jgi:hypothetical protein
MLLAIDLMVRHTGEDFVDVECAAVASVFSFQSSSVEAAEFDAPEANRFSRHSDAPLGQQIFNVSVAVTTRLRLKR